LGITLEFVANLQSGQEWWQRVGQRGRLRDLQPLLAAFPYPLAETSFMSRAVYAKP